MRRRPPRAPAAVANRTWTSTLIAFLSVYSLSEHAFISLQQFFNGWLLGYSAYDSPIKLGTYFNLDVCGSD